MSNHEQPRPVFNAARALGALSMVLGVVPLVGTAFGWIEWTADQTNAYITAVGTVIGALALALGIRVEKEVTPNSNPRDNALVPLVPIANDGLEEELEV